MIYSFQQKRSKGRQDQVHSRSLMVLNNASSLHYYHLLFSFRPWHILVSVGFFPLFPSLFLSVSPPASYTHTYTWLLIYAVGPLDIYVICIENEICLYSYHFYWGVEITNFMLHWYKLNYCWKFRTLMKKLQEWKWTSACMKVI